MATRFSPNHRHTKKINLPIKPNTFMQDLLDILAFTIDWSDN